MNAKLPLRTRALPRAAPPSLQSLSVERAAAAEGGEDGGESERHGAHGAARAHVEEKRAPLGRGRNRERRKRIRRVSSSSSYP